MDIFTSLSRIGVELLLIINIDVDSSCEVVSGSVGTHFRKIKKYGILKMDESH